MTSPIRTGSLKIVRPSATQLRPTPTPTARTATVNPTGTPEVPQVGERSTIDPSTFLLQENQSSHSSPAAQKSVASPKIAEGPTAGPSPESRALESNRELRVQGSYSTGSIAIFDQEEAPLKFRKHDKVRNGKRFTGAGYTGAIMGGSTLLTSTFGGIIPSPYADPSILATTSSLSASMGLGFAIGGTMAGSLATFGLYDEKIQKSFSQHFTRELERSRNADGRFRTKSGTTQLDTLRETYGENFAAGLPGEMPLGTLRNATGTSLTQMVRNPDTITKAKDKLVGWEAPKPTTGGRSRNADGRIRQKRGDTRIDTLRKSYGLDFAEQLPGSLPLATLREVTGMSLSQILEKPKQLRQAFAL